MSLLDVAAIAALAIGLLLFPAAAVSDSRELFAFSGVLATAGSLVVAVRLWQWARRVSGRQEGMHAWEFRPALLVLVLATAAFLAVMGLDRGREDFAAWCIPGGMALLLGTMGRVRLSSFVRALVDPVYRPPDC